MDLFRNPPRLPLIAPSILSADFGRMAYDCAHVLNEAGADLLHVDVMDGHFVPNLTMGPALLQSVRAHLPDAFLDVHLMVTDPQQFIQPFATAGANHITFHIEPAQDRHAGAGLSPLSQGYDVTALAETVRGHGMTAGLALNPETPVDAVLDVAGGFDLLLVMSVHPGFSGQAFIPEVLSKVERLRDHLGPGIRIQMDGGIKPGNADDVRRAGCDVLVAASAVFGVPEAERGKVVTDLRGVSGSS
ncbi:MAG: ribulose-phosphate 3-epimerase [Planctomycetota bacterium]